jgi:hypothetical protein
VLQFSNYTQDSPRLHKSSCHFHMDLREMGGGGGKDVNLIIWLRTGNGGWLCEHSNEPSGSVKGGGGGFLTI